MIGLRLVYVVNSSPAEQHPGGRRLVSGLPPVLRYHGVIYEALQRMAGVVRGGVDDGAHGAIPSLVTV